MFFIRKKMPRPHALGEPILHENHPKPVTRREMLGAGLRSAPALVIGPAWLGMALKPNKANATLVDDILQLTASGQCGLATSASGIPVICFDLAGGANLVGSEVLVGQKGGQSNFLTTAGYGKMGLPGNMVPTAGSTFVNSSFGLLWHSDGAILRGMQTKASAGTAANTNGAVICGMSQNDTNTNPHNPMYGIAAVGARGKLLNLVGNQSSVSGGNSMAYNPNPLFQPTTIAVPSDDVALVSTGGAASDPVSIAVADSQVRISGGVTHYGTNQGVVGSEFSGVLAATNAATAQPGQSGVNLYVGNPTVDAAIKNQVRCAYVQAAYTADQFGDPGALNPLNDVNITGGATPIFTSTDFQDSDVQKTASVMKLVLNGFAAAGTITLGGYDYHDSTRATGETRNFKAGQLIGAVLEYAARVGKQVMIYVFSDGSLSSSAMVDTSTAGRNKLAWQGDNQSVSSTFFLVYNPTGRPTVAAGGTQQIGYYTADGAVDPASSPAANSVMQIPEVMLLNYLGLHNMTSQFGSFFKGQGLGASSAWAAMTAFSPIASPILQPS